MNASPKPEGTREPIRCLVVQLARLGDTIQSLMALRAAKQLYPELEIHFVAREKFASAARRVPWLHNVIPLPTESLLGPILSGDKRESEGLKEIARWVQPLVQEPWDMVINWSYSEASSYLTGLLPARIKLGYSRRKDTSFSSIDGWSNYIQGVVQGRIEQNIHLTDILTTQVLTALQIHFGDPANEGNSPVTSKSFFSLELGEHEIGAGWNDLSRKWIAMQLGAGREDKTWKPENWAIVAAKILRRHPECGVILLGGNEDQVRARRFLAALQAECASANTLELERRVISLVGQTDFDLWASVVGRCQWLFAGDTAAIHLASVLGTRVLNLSIGPVRWAETGPYGNGHYVVASAQSSAEELKPEAVYATWAYGSSEWSHRRQMTLKSHFAHLGYSELASEVRVYRSRIRDTQDGGGVCYDPMFHQPMDMAEWSSMVVGHIARAWYCGWTPPVGNELNRDRISPTLIRKLRELRESTGVLGKLCEEAVRTALSLNRHSMRLKSDKLMNLTDRDELRALGKKLIEIDSLVDRVGKVHPALTTFSQMSKVLMHNLSGDALAELGRESADAYKQLGEGVSLMNDWLDHTLKLARPVAIAREVRPQTEVPTS